MKETKHTSRSIGRAMGYSDDDLSTPGHDALVLWIRANLYQFLTATILDDLQERYVAEHSRVQKLEDQRSAGRPGTVPRSVKLAPDERWFTWRKPELEKHVQGGWIDVYVNGDVYTESDYSRNDRIELRPARWHLAVEVKTSIRSFGELLRQLRVYESALAEMTRFRADDRVIHGPKYIYVASPDDRFEEALADQGFGFCKLEIPPEVTHVTG